jgi:hypothetical protein
VTDRIVHPRDVRRPQPSRQDDLPGKRRTPTCQLPWRPLEVRSAIACPESPSPRPRPAPRTPRIGHQACRLRAMSCRHQEDPRRISVRPAGLHQLPLAGQRGASEPVADCPAHIDSSGVSPYKHCAPWRDQRIPVINLVGDQHAAVLLSQRAYACEETRCRLDGGRCSFHDHGCDLIGISVEEAAHRCRSTDQLQAGDPITVLPGRTPRTTRWIGSWRGEARPLRKRRWLDVVVKGRP